MDIRRRRLVVAELHTHLAFLATFHRDVLYELSISEIGTIFVRVYRDFEVDFVEFSGEHDCVQLLMTYPPKVSLSKLVNSLKGVTSRNQRAEATSGRPRLPLRLERRGFSREER
ncbi:IS200/IS605 family transposase [Methylobacterium radiodurans]|uniref:IS200/IS605 family transposase n=1 Tax=Methylobacterium radiodurans TaxID=2202828 RepID=UPI0013A58F33|nr:IS200/IS605 family transposase [Methylobacterium radiodurans]